MINERQREQYWQRGWLVVEGVLGADLVDEVAELARELSVAELPEMAVAGATAADAKPVAYRADVSDQGELAPRKIDRPYTRHARFRELVLAPEVRALLDAVVGVPMQLVTDQIFLKPPRFGSAKPYHQDNAYFLCSPADHVITAWIALDDVDEENGCLRYIDGSHRGPILPHVEVPGEPYNQAPPPELIDLSKESLAPVRKGGVVLHHSQTLHTSHANRSTRWRRGYASHWAALDVTAESSVLDDAYHLRDDYPRASSS